MGLNKCYDRIVSLGADCGVGSSLRDLKYKDTTYPFDWSVTKLEFVLTMFETDFRSLLDKKNLKEIKANGLCKNTSSSIYYHHDYSYETMLNDVEKYALTLAKYERRIGRLREVLESDYKVLYVRKSLNDSYSDVLRLPAVIRQRYPQHDFDICFMSTGVHKDVGNVYNYKCHEQAFLGYTEETDLYYHRSNVDWKAVPTAILQKVRIVHRFRQPETLDD